MATAFNVNTDSNYATALTYLNMPTEYAFSSGVEESASDPNGYPGATYSTGGGRPGLNAHQKEIFFNAFIMYVCYLTTNSQTMSATTLGYALRNALYSALTEGNRPGDTAQGALPLAGTTGHGWGTSGL